MLIFENKGLLEIEFLSTFGASVKNTKNPIGYFGTGLKYAIAVLLRFDCEIEIFVDTVRYVFTKAKRELRGQEFEIVHMNHQSLGFTTELGKNWELWQAYRELYCNMLDEQGTLLRTPDSGEKVGIPGMTRIYVSGLDYTADKHHEFFFTGEPRTISGGVEIKDLKSHFVFYRGVRVFDRATINTYNIVTTLDLTEDRTAKYSWDVKQIIQTALMQSTDKTIIRQALTCPEGYWEKDFDYEGQEPGETFLEVAKELNGKGNRKAYYLWKRTQEVSSEELTESQKQKLSVSFTILESMGIGFTRDKYPIYFVSDLPTDILGKAENGNIIISKEAFSSDITATILEEFVHLDKGFSDCSRGMQTWLFQQLVRLTEEKSHEYN